MLPTDPKNRKEHPIFSGVLRYFPDAITAVANLSYVGNKQHNGDGPLQWSRGKSNDHPDCLMRHLIEAGTVDTDGVRHSVKVAWRALAIAQLELEQLELEADVASPPSGAWELRWEAAVTDGQPARYLATKWNAFSTDGRPLNPEKRIGPDRRIYFTPIEDREPYQFRRATGLGTGRRCPT